MANVKRIVIATAATTALLAVVFIILKCFTVEKPKPNTQHLSKASIKDWFKNLKFKNPFKKSTTKEIETGSKFGTSNTKSMSDTVNNALKFKFKTKYTGNLPADMTAFTKEAEGGTVTAKTDSASKYAKVTADEPVHTNIGITRIAFDANADALGYDNSYSNFLAMPPDIWYKIFSQIYVKPFANISKVPVINDMIAGWGWGSGVGTAQNELKKFLLAKGVSDLDTLIAKQGELATFNDLVENRMEFFKAISPKYNPPTAKAPQGVYTDGWLNREANFQNIFQNYLT